MGRLVGEHGYIKLARYTSANDDSPKNKMKGHTNMTEPCGWDLQQYFNCNASKSTPQWVCGTSAVLCDAYYPRATRLLGKLENCC